MKMQKICQWGMLSHTRGASSPHLGEIAELDLTESRRPWPGIIASHDKRLEMVDAMACMRATGPASKGGVQFRLRSFSPRQAYDYLRASFSSNQASR